MTTSPIGQPSSPVSALGSGDRRLMVIAGAGASLSIAALLARIAGLMPDGPATVLVLIGATIAFKVARSYAAKSASASSRARVLTLISTVGLAISGVSMLLMLPHLTEKAGMGVFVSDLFAQLWALGILAMAAGPVRTLGWRAFVGAGLTGFLLIPALAGLLGRPVVDALGPSSLLAVSVWVPFTEELCKMIPVAFVVVLALRRTTIRPSALDLTLLGAWTGAGFALYENAVYGRGGAQFSAVPIISLLFPIETTTSAYDWTVVHAGHLVFSGLIATAVGLTVLYRKRFPRPALVLLTAFLVVFLEHSVGNALVATRPPSLVTDLMLIPTLGGRLSSLLLIAGVAYVLYVERRAIGAGAFRPEEWLQFRLPAAEAQRRSALLSRAQQATSQSTAWAQVLA